jgi:hypothetical protein
MNLVADTNTRTSTTHFRVLARMLRDARQPIDHRTRECLAQIVEALEVIHRHQAVLCQELPLPVNANIATTPDLSA